MLGNRPDPPPGESERTNRSGSGTRKCRHHRTPEAIPRRRLCRLDQVRRPALVPHLPRRHVQRHDPRDHR